MEVKQINTLIEPWIIRLIRKGATFGLTMLVTYLISKGFDLKPEQAVEWAIGIGTAVGIPLSYLISNLVDKLLKKYAKVSS